MQKEWAEHILTMIPEKLQQSPPLKEVINELFCEIRDDYTGSMKKSMGKSICVNTGQQPILTKYTILPTCINCLSLTNFRQTTFNFW